jgi:hypothetical protein
MVSSPHGAPQASASMPEQVDAPRVVLIHSVMLTYVCRADGPVASLLAELFPPQIRFGALSFPTTSASDISAASCCVFRPC